jgi:hypothetical protein
MHMPVFMPGFDRNTADACHWQSDAKSVTDISKLTRTSSVDISHDCRCGMRTYELICMVERVGTAVPSDRYTALRQLSASPVIVLPSDARPGFW